MVDDDGREGARSAGFGDSVLELGLPANATAALGPERAALEAVLLFLISETRMSVREAGEVLGLDERAAHEWWASQGHCFPAPGWEEPAEGRRSGQTRT